MIFINYWLFVFILLAAMVLSARLKKLTTGGSIMGGIVASCIYLGSGLAGLVLLAFFFVSGSLATSWKIKDKQQFHLAEKNNGKRNTRQVIANGGIAALAGLLAFINPLHQHIFQVMMTAALSAATADTLSSELGTIYGKCFYNILSFKAGIRGENGVVSTQGTLMGLAGSILVAIIFSVFFGFSSGFWWIIIAGTVGNITDSILGASLERKHLLSNNAVNFLNTFIAAMVALGGMLL